MQESQAQQKTDKNNNLQMLVSQTRQFNVPKQQNVDSFVMLSQSGVSGNNNINLQEQKQIIDLLATKQIHKNKVQDSLAKPQSNQQKVKASDAKKQVETPSKVKVEDILASNKSSKLLPQSSPPQASNKKQSRPQISKGQKKISIQQKKPLLLKKQVKGKQLQGKQAAKQKKEPKSGNQIKQQKQKQKQQKDKNLREIVKQKDIQLQNKQIKAKTTCPEVEITFNQMFMPLDKNIQLIQTIEKHEIVNDHLALLYRKKLFKTNRFLIQPLQVILKNQGQQKLTLSFCTQHMTKFQDIEIKLQSQFIFIWLLQILFTFHPNNSVGSLKKQYIKIVHSNIFVAQTPFLQQLIKRQQKYVWENPFRILVTNLVKNQKQYYEQMYVFDEKFKLIKSFQDLKKQYFQLHFGKMEKQVFSIPTMADKIKQRQIYSSNQVSNQSMQAKQQLQSNFKWIKQTIGIGANQVPYEYFKASECNFDPQRFWQKIRALKKTDNKNQLLVLQISGPSKRLIGFSSSILDSKNPQNLNHIPQYLQDSSLSSLILNISQKTVHSLKDPLQAVAYSNQLLLCIGKCDIVLSAFNITNLCYFPVSFTSDEDQTCISAQNLCGAKKFKLQQLTIYRFSAQEK